MDIEKYLTMKCIWEKNEEYDEEFMTVTLAAPVEISCFKYGDIRNIRTTDMQDNMSDQTYLVTEHVKVGDKIDGQTVRRVFEVPDFDGTMTLYEVHVLRS